MAIAESRMKMLVSSREKPMIVQGLDKRLKDLEESVKSMRESFDLEFNKHT